MAEDHHGIYISMKDVYDQVVNVKDEIRGVSGKVDNYKNVSEDHEKRIRALEVWKYALPATILSSIGAIALEVFRISGK